MVALPLALRGRFLLSLAVASLLTICAHERWGKDASARTALVHFWMGDLPPLSGASRIYIYLSLLLTALLSHYARPHLGDSPLQAPELFQYTLPEFFSKEGAMKLLHHGAWVNTSSLRALRAVTVLAFLMCVVGFGGQLPPMVVGVGMVLLHGVVQGCIGTSHRWYVPVYTCAALAFANGNADHSVDAYLFRRWGHAYPFAPVCLADGPSGLVPATLVCSGYARKMVLLAGVSTLFFGAITKWINGGLAWLDGQSLSYYVSSEENGRSMLLKKLMSRYRFVSLFLSLASIGLEAGSVVAVFVPWTRPLVLVSAAGMHLGIWLTMWPNYFPQTLCYALGARWWWERNASDLSVWSPSDPTLLRACWIGVFLWLFLSMVAALRIEWWPLTGIPMYSFYRDSTYSYKHLRDAKQAQLVALEHTASGYPNAIAWSNLWINLRLKNTDPAVTEERRARKQRLAAQQQQQSQQPQSQPHRGGGGASPRDVADSPSDSAYASTMNDASSTTAAAAEAARSAALAAATPAAAVVAAIGAAAVERKSAESSGLVSSEREFVNLKSRVIEPAYTLGGRAGVYLKQWRRTLHNVAAADMAAKPLGAIETDRTGAQRVYPALRWLRAHLPALRHYARVNRWQLPPWVDATGELQLRVKLKDRYAILASIPWNEGAAAKGEEATATAMATAAASIDVTAAHAADPPPAVLLQSPSSPPPPPPSRQGRSRVFEADADASPPASQLTRRRSRSGARKSAGSSKKKKAGH